MSHSPHPDIHEHGLADDCERCAEIADRPMADLDDAALLDLVIRTLRSRFGEPDEDAPFGPYVAARSENEAVAMAQVMNALERAGRIAEVAPGQLARYLSERWKSVLQWV